MLAGIKTTICCNLRLFRLDLLLRLPYPRHRWRDQLCGRWDGPGMRVLGSSANTTEVLEEDWSFPRCRLPAPEATLAYDTTEEGEA